MLFTLFDIGAAAGIAALVILGLIHGVILIALLEYRPSTEKRIAGGILTAIVIAAAIGLGNTSFFAWLAEHWIQAIAYGLGYIVAGPIVGFLKWLSRAHEGAERWFTEMRDYLASLPDKIRETTQLINAETEHRTAEKSYRGYYQFTDEQITKMRKDLAAWDTAVKAGDMTPECLAVFKEHITQLEKSTGRLYHCPDPDEKGNLGLFVGWSSFWPWEVAWLVINDPLRRIMTAIYRLMKTQLRKAAQYAWRSVTAKMEAIEANAKAKAAAQAGQPVKQIQG